MEENPTILNNCGVLLLGGKMKSFVYEIRSLSDDFYLNYPHSTYSEIMRKNG